MSIQEKFLAAVDIINSLPSDGAFQPSEDLMLKLDAFYMQATDGPCNIPKPSYWCFSSRMKWNAWNELGKMPKEVAMENYVEELTKVIETMSYNETVSRFMSLIGPFYEVVSTDEIDQLSEKKLTNRTHTEFPYPVKLLDDLQTAKLESSDIDIFEASSSSISDELHVCSPDSPSERSLKRHKCDPGSQASTLHKSATDILMPKTSNLKIQPLVSQQDILILTIINLQSSLEDIVKKLDNLQNLAKSADFKYKVLNEENKYKDWNLNIRNTAFVLLWPVFVHLCMRGF